ncbi:Magnesium-protoporphyrin O-methyltransferase [Rosistilla carotiformis]|uniref:Magnesium-protoporphyrin O-methyltransferase n=1 Tax=Rosistilla carotiformis TaxID=2528017 RepID=A0A518JSM5_9BACT|nr:class I SAM-dependent methyltransferase [Rosistilla carotiformis]QDV68540.1 Magnesium-protoporphyrin O-methyltransferase [Rosistilla carotiformis]
MPTNPQTDRLYDDDVAYIHDVGYSGLCASWEPGLLEIFYAAGIDRGTIVDLGCGGGRWTQRLAAAGFAPVGVDISAAMIDLATKRLPSTEFHVASVWDYEFPRCRAVTALSEVLCYRTPSCDDPDLCDLFRRIFNALEPGGLFIFDVTEIGLDQNGQRTFSEGEDWACLVLYENDDSKQRLYRHITSFRQVDSLYRRATETHTAQLFDAAQLAEQLNQVGFEVRKTRKFGTADLLPHRCGLIASKPQA